MEKQQAYSQRIRSGGRTERYYALDLLKIVATVFIVFHHYQQTTGAYYPGLINFYNGRFYWGYIVEFFFVVSGFVVSSYSERIMAGLSFKAFYLKRYLRVAPVMASGAIAYELFLIVYIKKTGNSWFDITPTLWGTIIAILGIQEGWGFRNPYVNNPTWYISVLLLCYVLFYLSNYISHRLSVSKCYFYIAFIFLGIGIRTYGINLPFLNGQVARGYYAMFWGVLLSSFFSKPPHQKKLNLITLFTSLLSIMIVYLVVTESIFVKKDISYLLTFVVYTFLICFTHIPFIQRITRLPVLRTIANISFNVFIWHNPLFFSLYLIPAFFKVSINYNLISTMLIYTLICFIFGTLSYYFLDLPTNKIIDTYLKNSNDVIIKQTIV